QMRCPLPTPRVWALHPAPSSSCRPSRQPASRTRILRFTSMTHMARLWLTLLWDWNTGSGYLTAALAVSVAALTPRAQLGMSRRRTLSTPSTVWVCTPALIWRRFPRLDLGLVASWAVLMRVGLGRPLFLGFK